MVSIWVFVIMSTKIVNLMNWGSQFVVDRLLLEYSTSRNYDDLVQPVVRRPSS